MPYDGVINTAGQGYCILNNLTSCGYTRFKGAASDCTNPQTKLRIINAGAFAVFNISVDNHRMILVSEDGVLIEPVNIGSLQINNGQRKRQAPRTVLGTVLQGDIRHVRKCRVTVVQW